MFGVTNAHVNFVPREGRTIFNDILSCLRRFMGMLVLAFGVATYRVPREGLSNRSGLRLQTRVSGGGSDASSVALFFV